VPLPHLSGGNARHWLEPRIDGLFHIIIGKEETNSIGNDDELDDAENREVTFLEQNLTEGLMSRRGTRYGEVTVFMSVPEGLSRGSETREKTKRKTHFWRLKWPLAIRGGSCPRSP
jgi:hypothetical protein